MLTNRSQDERGTVAIMVALLSLLLISMAALAVDLGLARVERREVQTVTDMAALAGAAGRNLPGTTSGTCNYGLRATVTDQAVLDVADHLGTGGWDAAPTAAQLVDCQTTNGEVFYGSVQWTSAGVTLTHNPYQLTVVSPGQWVGFGFAQVMGFDGVTVTAQATAEIQSPAINALPLYAFTGCDFGRQTISQPNNGHAASSVPPLMFPSDSNAATVQSLVTSPVTTPPSIPLPAPDPSTLEITGTKLDQVTHVGFFEPGGSAIDPPAPVEVDASGFTTPSSSRILVTRVPSSVLSVPGAWYVRVKIGTEWSRVPDPIAPIALTIGTPTLTCGQGSSEGNFGSLLLANATSGQWQQIALNIAAGLQNSLAIFPTASADWTCTDQTGGAVLWPLRGTNCVDTKPGMVANAAYAGFIEGIGEHPGLLTRLDAGSGCAVDGVPSSTTLPGPFVINNDTLSCFLTNDTTNIGTISSADYAGDVVLKPAIYRSPRFVMVPLLGRQPETGGSKKYQIVGFRPAFITSQLSSATRAIGALSGNGLTLGNHTLESVQVVFINAAALPPMDALDPVRTTPYAGSGPRVLRLVD